MQIKSNAQNKIRYGIGVDQFQTKLNNVDRKTFSGYGHSNPGFKQNNLLGFGINGIIKIPIYKSMGLQTGLGLTRYATQFHFQYYHSFSQQWMDKRFSIGINYANVPLNIYYDIKLTNKSSIIVFGGMNIKLLLWINDNFNDIIFEKINLPNIRQRYESVVYNYNSGVSYKYRFNRHNALEIGINFGRDVNPMVNNKPKHPENFGFYANLHEATYSQYGLFLNYFFNH